MNFLHAFERLIFASRWLLAAFYLMLFAALGALLVKAGQHMAEMAAHVLEQSEAQVTLDVLALIDLTLTASLIVIVIFSGYENFVSRVDPAVHKNWPQWMTQIDFSGLKMKLLATIIAIASIQLLKVFIKGGADERADLPILAGVVLTFAVTGVLLALSDRIDHPPE